MVDPKSALYLTGSQLEFYDDINRSGFEVENPNASNTCGCGESFS
jgi:iron-sulfur cluster assembly protein